MFYVFTSFKKARGFYQNIIFPRTFSEKIQRRKIFDRDCRLHSRADKILAKDFVSQKLGDQWVIPTLWHGQELPAIAERLWPPPFVIKTNHASGANIFIKTENDLDWAIIERQIECWMKITYGYYAGEWLYSKIKPQILVEPFIGDTNKLPFDYKFWTFKGKVKFIQVDTDRGTEHKRVFYDAFWNKLPFSLGYPLEKMDIPIPNSLNEMICAAETLSENISFVRVDFYEIHGRPLFGELTFYPGSGYDMFNPNEWDNFIGELY